MQRASGRTYRTVLRCLIEVSAGSNVILVCHFGGVHADYAFRLAQQLTVPLGEEVHVGIRELDFCGARHVGPRSFLKVLTEEAFERNEHYSRGLERLKIIHDHN